MDGSLLIGKRVRNRFKDLFAKLRWSFRREAVKWKFYCCTTWPRYSCFVNSFNWAVPMKNDKKKNNQHLHMGNIQCTSFFPGVCLRTLAAQQVPIHWNPQTDTYLHTLLRLLSEKITVDKAFLCFRSWKVVIDRRRFVHCRVLGGDFSVVLCVSRLAYMRLRSVYT